ncbi:MaoC family dehydratase [Thermodesulfobacteriota bacterium]
MTRQRKYYEDFEVGDHFVAGRQTVTEAEIVNFVTSNGWFDRLFIDVEFVKSLGYKDRIAPGPLVMALAMGQWSRLDWRQGSGMGMLGLQAKYYNPLYPGDTIATEVDIVSKKETSKPSRGVIDLKFTAKNQHDVVLAEFTETILFGRKPK